MIIKELKPLSNYTLHIVADNGCIGNFDVSPYLKYEVFHPLKDKKEFLKITNGGYFIEWDCGSDLSADTIEAKWKVINK